jgi:mercuric ion binding protein|tara:strand:- start:1764 stop:2255 length:492 start_codon:yes stop_codon:yes gene_type:complete
MKRPIFYILILLVVSCTSKNPEKKTVSHSDEAAVTMSDKNLSNISFQVEGMTCEVGCAARIEKKVAAMEGVAMSKVDFEAKTAFVSFDPTTTSFDKVKTTIESLGDDYKVGEATAVAAFSLEQNGKKCDKSCEKACCKKEGKDKKACKANCEKPCCAKKKEKA